MIHTWYIGAVLIAFIGGYHLAMQMLQHSGAVYWRLLERVYNSDNVLHVTFAKSSGGHIVATVMMTDRTQHCFTAASLEIAVSQIYGLTGRN